MEQHKRYRGWAQITFNHRYIPGGNGRQTANIRPWAAILFPSILIQAAYQIIKEDIENAVSRKED